LLFEEAWGKWKEQREGEKTADYLTRIYQDEISLWKRKTRRAEERTCGIGSILLLQGAPKAAAYYEADGREWYWWDGACGDKWEPKKKKKKKHTEAEWEQRGTRSISPSHSPIGGTLCHHSLPAAAPGLI